MYSRQIRESLCPQTISILVNNGPCTAGTYNFYKFIKFINVLHFVTGITLIIVSIEICPKRRDLFRGMSK